MAARDGCSDHLWAEVSVAGSGSIGLVACISNGGMLWQVTFAGLATLIGESR